MPIRIELAPNERLYIGKGILVNGKFRSEFILEGRQPILRNKDYLPADVLKTEVDRFYHCIQQMYLEGASAHSSDTYNHIRSNLVAHGDVSAEVLDAVDDLLKANQHYKALKKLGLARQ